MNTKNKIDLWEHKINPKNITKTKPAIKVEENRLNISEQIERQSGKTQLNRRISDHQKLKKKNKLQYHPCKTHSSTIKQYKKTLQSKRDKYDNYQE